jgi:hypothetical protein
MAADRPYGEFYDFYSVRPEYFGYHHVYMAQSVYQGVHVLDDMLKAKSVWSKKGASGCLRDDLVQWPAATACGKYGRYKLTDSLSPYLYFRTYEISMSYVTLVSMIHTFHYTTPGLRMTPPKLEVCPCATSLSLLAEN